MNARTEGLTSVHKDRLRQRRMAYKSPMQIAIALCAACLLIVASMVPLPAYAAVTIKMPERVNATQRKDINYWTYQYSNKSGVAAQVSKGVRKDTEKVSRTLLNEIKGLRRGINLRLAKQVKINYEVYKSGPKKGQIYRVYKPTIKHTSKTASYLGVFRLSVSPNVRVTSNYVDSRGRGIVKISEQTTFKLPQQFPIRRDAFSQMLRQQFKIQSAQATRTFIITPNKNYGTLSITLSEY